MCSLIPGMLASQLSFVCSVFNAVFLITTYQKCLVVHIHVLVFNERDSENCELLLDLRSIWRGSSMLTVMWWFCR